MPQSGVDLTEDDQLTADLKNLVSNKCITRRELQVFIFQTVYPGAGLREIAQGLGMTDTDVSRDISCLKKFGGVQIPWKQK